MELYKVANEDDREPAKKSAQEQTYIKAKIGFQRYF